MAAPGADVRSIPALSEWLGTLAAYQSAASDSLAGVQMEIRRGIVWIEEQLTLWQRAVRDCEEEVVQAKAELAARKFPNWDGRPPDTTVQEKNLRRAKARLEYTEEKVRICRAWVAKIPKMIDEAYTGAGHRLQVLLEVDVARGAAVLARRLDALERYAGLRTDLAPTLTSVPISPPPPPSAEGSG